MASRSFSPLPCNASAVLVMNRPTDVVDTPLEGPSSVANLINCALISSHSTGTAVRSSPMTAPSAMVGPVDS